MAIPWEEIEQEYTTGTIGQRELAEKYGVSVPAVSMHSKAGNWVQKRAEYMKGKIEEDQGAEILPGEGYFVLELPPDAEKLKPRERHRLYSPRNIPQYAKDDPIQVRNRIESYFDFCNKYEIPTSPVDLAKWLKITFKTLERWRDGEYRKSTHQNIIEEAWDRIHSSLIMLAQTGGINPTTAIFLLKNWFAYKDVKDFVVAPKNPLGELQDKKALEQRIMGTVVVEDFSVVEEGAQK